MLKPRLARVDWELRQEFTREDDPDRTSPEHDWATPAFIAAVDPSRRARQTVATDFDVSHVQGYRQGFSFARAVDGVLTESECVDILRALNGKKFTPALVGVGGGVQQYIPDYRDSFRVIQDSPPFADWLTEVLRPHLPPTMDGELSQWGVACNELELSEVSSWCRFLCYLPGQQFKPHSDGGEMRRPRGSEESSTARDLSLITIQLYLHDLPAASGGATRFLARPQTKPDVDYQPKAGSVLLFTQELSHEGVVVEEACRKFTMRSEVMYSGHHIGRITNPGSPPRGNNR